jgi:hypothetical protein
VSRHLSFLRILQASAVMQQHISIILEGKAVEADKAKHWFRNHMFDGGLGGHAEQLQASVDVHEKLIETIDGLAKLEGSLARNLKIVLNQKEDDKSGGSFGFDSLFGSSGDN